MKRIAFLSADNFEGYVIDDQLSYEPLRRLGWNAETISWRKTNVDWSEFAGVIIRSTWDYQRHLPEFLATLERIATATRLANPLEIGRWNADKIYLRDLEKRGAQIVPTIWKKPGIDRYDIERWFSNLKRANW